MFIGGQIFFVRIIFDTFIKTQYALDSSVILFLQLFFIKFSSEKHDSQAYAEEKFDRIAIASFSKERNVAGMALHVLNNYSSAFL